MRKLTLFLLVFPLWTVTDYQSHAWAAASDSFYSVQIASFKDAENARGVVQDLKAQGRDVFYVKTKVEGVGERFRVYTGKYGTRNAALKAAETLKQDKVIDTYVLQKVNPADVSEIPGQIRSPAAAPAAMSEQVPDAPPKLSAPAPAMAAAETKPETKIEQTMEAPQQPTPVLPPPPPPVSPLAEKKPAEQTEPAVGEEKTLAGQFQRLQSEDIKSDSYFGIIGGIVWPLNLTLRSNSGDPGLPDSQGYPLNTGYLLGARLGWLPMELKKYFAFELEYNRMTGMKFDTETRSFLGANQSYQGNITVDAFLFNIFARYPLGRIHPYAGGGIGWAWFKQDDLTKNTNGVVTGAPGEMASAFCYDFAAGVNYDLVPGNWSIGLQYKYFRTKPSLYGAIQYDYDFSTHIVTLGVDYFF